MQGDRTLHILFCNSRAPILIIFTETNSRRYALFVKAFLRHTLLTTYLFSFRKVTANKVFELSVLEFN